VKDICATVSVPFLPRNHRLTWYFWHPALSILAEELSLGRELVGLVKSSPHDVSKLVRRLFTIFTDESAAIVAKLSNYAILLLEGLGFALVVAETTKSDLDTISYSFLDTRQVDLPLW
jgi:hypothetical protein